MRKSINTILIILIASSLHAQQYKTINFIATKNYAGVLKKLVTINDKGAIYFSKGKVTINSCGSIEVYKITKTTGDSYTLENGNQLIVSIANKQIRYDVRINPEDELYSYTYIYNLE